MSNADSRADSQVTPQGHTDRTDGERQKTMRHPPLRLLAIRLTVAGLVVELLSFALLHHPAGFLTFLTLGCALLGAGVVAYVTSVLRQIDRLSRGHQ